MKIRKPIIRVFVILGLVLLVVSPQAAYGNFRIVVLPDTQNESQNNPSMFTAQTQWIANNKASLNIAFVAHVGDMVNTCTSSTQYGNADGAMDLLDGGSVHYGVSPGNHDQANSGTCGSSSLYPSYFGTSRFSGKSYYGGRLDDYNHYFFFSADGMDFIIIFLQYYPVAAQLNWANGLLQLYSNHRGIVVSHGILNVNNTWVTLATGVTGETIYNSLKSNPNLFLMLCGHMHSATDGEALRTETRAGANPVYIILSDFQDFSSGNGWLRILEFDPSVDQINVITYSPYTGTYRTGSDSQYSLDYNMLAGDISSFDCDVDGSDLAALISNQSLLDLDLTTFATNFGRNSCQ
jgi:hypothetical protein